MPQLRSRSPPSSRFRPVCCTMAPAQPCVFETSRGYRNDARVDIAATIRNRLIVAIQPELRVALGRWRACGFFRWPTAGRWRSCLTGVYGGAAVGGSQGPLAYRVVRASSASIHRRRPRKLPRRLRIPCRFRRDIRSRRLGRRRARHPAVRARISFHGPVPILRLRPANRVWLVSCVLTVTPA